MTAYLKWHFLNPDKRDCNNVIKATYAVEELVDSWSLKSSVHNLIEVEIEKKMESGYDRNQILRRFAHHKRSCKITFPVYEYLVIDSFYYLY